MNAALERQLRKLLVWSKERVKQNKTVRKLVYDVDNVKEFTNMRLHEHMLSDSVRVSTYAKGIKRCIKPGDVVVDLGAGTGILSFLAAKQRPRKIYAVDHSDILKMAEEIGKRNGIGNISYIRMNSREFSPVEKVDVILHEQMGMNIFSENMVENLLDLKKRILKPSGVIIPAKFDLFVEPVVLKDECRIPFIWEQKIEGIDYSFLKGSALLNELRPDRHHFFIVRGGGDVEYFVCEPEAVLSFDLNHMNDESDIPHRVSAEKAVTRDGTIDGLYVYFRCMFDSEVGFDTSPLSKTMHWPHMLLRTERTHVKVGDFVSTTLDMESLVEQKTWRATIKISPA